MAACGLDPRRVADLKANAPRPDHLFNAFLQGAELALAEVRTTATN